MAIENCPKCEEKLPPLLSSGRQVCKSCGWSEQKSKPKLENSEQNDSDIIDSSSRKNATTEQAAKSFKTFANKSEYILLAILGLLVFSKLSKPTYEYTVASPSDSKFSESMSEYGAKGWKAVECRRAKDKTSCKSH